MILLKWRQGVSHLPDYYAYSVEKQVYWYLGHTPDYPEHVIRGVHGMNLDLTGYQRLLNGGDWELAEDPLLRLQEGL